MSALSHFTAEREELSPLVHICPRCKASYSEDVRACPNDGRRPLPQDVIEAGGGDPLLGATLAERYTLTGRIGAGGMGTVYRAEQAPLGRQVALKVLRKELGRDPETVARFSREARLLSQLRHPNTVAILDFGHSPEGLLYLAMELLEGEMLSSRLRARGALDVTTAVRVASGVLRSLDEAHARGIVHRDLKPDNIFLARVHGRPDDDEVVKVVDFGIAKIRDGEHTQGLDPVATQEGTVFGTPRYMSPEQAQGRSLDGRSDLYAVGVLLFHMLTGHPPFTDDDAVIVMAHHIKTEPEPVRRLAPDRGIPESLEALVACALAKNPDDRPQSAEAFLTELESLGADLDAARMRARLATEQTAIIAVPRPQRRAWVGLVAAAAALVVMFVGFSMLDRRAVRNAAQGAQQGQRVVLATRATAGEPPSSLPQQFANAPPVAAPETPVAAPETPVAALQSPVVVEPTHAPDGSSVPLRPRWRQPSRQRVEAPAPRPPVVTAPQPNVRRSNQPYQTFDGL